MTLDVENKNQKLAIVIVNWNAGAHLLAVLRSIHDSRLGRFPPPLVIVVDNASSDDSVAQASAVSPNTVFLKQSQNLGFAAACNIGASSSDSTYILFLNPDVVLEPTTIAATLEQLENPVNHDVAVIGCKLYGTDGKVHRSCARFPTWRNYLSHATGLARLSPQQYPGIPLAEWDHLTTRYVPHVIGAYYLIRRNVFSMLDGFDERFFVYLEDLDLSARVYESGLKVLYFSGAQAMHVGGGTSENARGTALFYSLRSRLRYVRKRRPPLEAAIVFFITLAVEPISRVVFALAMRRLASVSETIYAFARLWGCAFESWHAGAANRRGANER